MEFDIVIATRNRQRALAASLPLMLCQERLPTRLIVVDASDDGAGTRSVVEAAMEQTKAPVRLTVLQSEPGLCKQRNRSLKHVDAPIVFFPDDDALWFPGFAQAVMSVYEKDREGLIGAVGGTESSTPPPGLLPGRKAPTDGLSVKLPGFIERTINAFERRFFMDPFFLEAGFFYRNRKLPEWLKEEQAVPASTITGFRMSFRTELIRRTGFDEILGRYGLFEDHDACMGILESHCIVNAGRAKVFHDRPSERRADELELGMMHVLNRAYIVCKHAPPGSGLRRAMLRHAWYKLVRYALQSYTPAMRRRLIGAFRATISISRLCVASKEDLSQTYLALREECLNGAA